MQALRRGYQPIFKSYSRNFTHVRSTELPGHMKTVQQLNLDIPDPSVSRPAFQILNEQGKLCAGATIPSDINETNTTHMYKTMVQLQVMDQILYEVQRQGRISFYMTSSGEEGLNIGSASALTSQDVVFAQYRESGVLMYRGFTLEEMLDQCFATKDDLGKGRQMPVHYGSRRLNYHTVSSPLATQIPQAVGAAYNLKLNENNDAIVACYFGEGAASEGDFHPALNFSSTLDCPILFFCRNNGYAISTPAAEQFRGDGVVSRAIGYGVASIRVDGNDVFAVRQATQEARKYILENNRPVLLEAMTYRQGHHSTSDDSTRYRAVEEIELWRSKFHPITRMKVFMQDQGWWNEEKDENWRKECRQNVLTTVKKAEDKGTPEAMDNIFKDVYDKIPPNLQRQQMELENHIAKYPNHYVIQH